MFINDRYPFSISFRVPNAHFRNCIIICIISLKFNMTAVLRSFVSWKVCYYHINLAERSVSDRCLQVYSIISKFNKRFLREIGFLPLKRRNLHEGLFRNGYIYRVPSYIYWDRLLKWNVTSLLANIVNKFNHWLLFIFFLIFKSFLWM